MKCQAELCPAPALFLVDFKDLEVVMLCCPDHLNQWVESRLHLHVFKLEAEADMIGGANHGDFRFDSTNERCCAELLT